MPTLVKPSPLWETCNSLISWRFSFLKHFFFSKQPSLTKWLKNYSQHNETKKNREKWKMRLLLMQDSPTQHTFHGFLQETHCCKRFQTNKRPYCPSFGLPSRKWMFAKLSFATWLEHIHGCNIIIHKLNLTRWNRNSFLYFISSMVSYWSCLL